MEAVHAPELRDVFAGRDVFVVDGEDVHAEGAGALGDGASGAAEADDAHGGAAELEHDLAHGRTAGPALRRFEGGALELTRQGQEEAEGVVGQVLADEAFLTGDFDVAGDHLRVHQHVGAGGGGVEPAQIPGERERLLVEDAHRHLGVGPVLERLVV